MSNPLLTRPRPRAVVARVALAAAAATFALPSSARGNMANPVRAGARVGEPAAALAGLFVTDERLGIDLRPLAADSDARIEAVYHIRNDGAARTVPLLFVADALVARGSGVWLDGKPVDATPTATSDLPKTWRAPTSTPAIGGGEPLGYAVAAEGGALRFALTFAPGEHEVRVRYRARPTALSGDSPALYWQLAYVLAPAREWAGFGELTAHVTLPHRWRAAVNPHMRRHGDELVGTWKTLPADAIAITAQAPAGSGGGRWALLVALSAAALAFCGWVASLLGRALARRGRTSAWALGPDAGLALAWGVGTGIAVAALPSSIAAGMGPQRAWTYGYATGMLGLLLVPVLFLLGIVVLQVAAFLGGRAAHAPNYPAPKAGPRSTGAGPIRP